MDKNKSTLSFLSQGPWELEESSKTEAYNKQPQDWCQNLLGALDEYILHTDSGKKNHNQTPKPQKNIPMDLFQEIPLCNLK